jgi:hypothetical protein
LRNHPRRCDGVFAPRPSRIGQRFHQQVVFPQQVQHIARARRAGGRRQRPDRSPAERVLIRRQHLLQGLFAGCVFFGEGIEQCGYVPMKTGGQIRFALRQNRQHQVPYRSEAAG